MWDAAPPIEKLEAAVSDPTNAIGMRMRAAYFLKQAYNNDPTCQERVIKCLSEGLLEERNGSLMRHEYGYVMGQLRDERCCNVLEKILCNENDCSMVRHEAAEALAAIGATRSRSVLEEVKEKTRFNLPEVYETCLLALNVMDWRERGGHKNPDEEAPVACACMLNPYSSVDPAPPHPSHANKTIKELGDILCDSQQSMFDRYRAMFSLRNRGGEAAVLELCRVLLSDASSALLRHEVSYVLGQLQHPASVAALEESLRRQDEHQMVRHESAEALGAIESSWERIEPILEEFSKDDNQVVRESCAVALDAADYWGHNTVAATDDEENDDKKTTAVSFVQQKAMSPEALEKCSNGRSLANQVLSHHFNIKE